MAHQVIERPNKYCFSKNEIRYGYSVDDLLRTGLYLELRLKYKILTGKAKINWHNNEAAFDCNLFIKVNGFSIREIFATSQGSDLVKGGDIVEVKVPTLTAWGAGTPYVKMVIIEDGVQIYNEYTTDQDEPNWLNHTFTAKADSLYTIYAYTKDEADQGHAVDPDEPLEDLYTELTSWKLKPNADGSVYIPIHQYIDSLLNYVIPNGAFTNASAQTCFFYMESREIYDGHTNPDYTTTESEHIRLALKAGIEKHRYARNNFFVNYFDTDKPWMTWQPSNRLIWPNQPIYISAFLKTGTANTYTLRVKYKTTAAVESETNIALTIEGFMIHFKVDPATLGIPTAGLYYYEVAILDGADIIVSDYRYYINHDPCYKFYDFISIGSLAGIDCVRVAGEVSIGIDINFEEIEGGPSVNEWSQTVKSHESAQGGITFRRIFKGDIGYQRTIREQESYISTLLSRNIYQIIDGRFVPILFNRKNLLLRKNTDKLINLPVEWSLSEENESFTPQEINLGIGSDTEVY